MKNQEVEKSNLQKFEHTQKMLLLGLKVKEKSNVEMIAQTKVATEIARKNIEPLQVPKDIEKVIADLLHDIKLTYQIFPVIKYNFIKNNLCPDGFLEKSVINALKEPKYNKHLKSYNMKIKKQRLSNEDTLMESLVCSNLSINPVEIKAIFKVISNAFPVLIQNLEKNNVTNIEYVTHHTIILLSRLYKLYDIYGYYLKDNERVKEFEEGTKLFKNMINTFDTLLYICSALEDVNKSK